MPHPQPTLARTILRPWPISIVLAIAFALIFAIPGSGSPAGTIATAGWILLTSLPLALAWMISAWGLGVWIARWVSPNGPWVLGVALGAAVLLWIGHVLGICGVLSPTASWAMLAPGFVGGLAAIWTSRAPKDRRCGPSWWMLLGAPALGLMLAAACLPPGSIWASEAHGYDVLEYHLQLPKEWLAAGCIWPTDHNVYSFLPSYMESAFAHLGAMTGIDARSVPFGAGSGVPVHAAQMLHALFAILAAWCVGTVVRTICADSSCHGQPGARAGNSPDMPRQAGHGTQILAHPRLAPACAGAAMLSVPWVIVTGSMAYNEMAMCAMLAAAILAAWQKDIPVWRRGIAVGLLIGAACSLKPTAIFLAMPVAAIVVAARTKPRAWFGAFACAAIVGGATIAPWLIRNWIASGNPVFPSLASVFGPGPWSESQHARWTAAHHLDLSIVDRLGRLVSSDFGVLHAQWSIWVFVALGAIVVCIVGARARRLGWPVLAGLAVQIIAWESIGHLQSRFLIPIGVTSAIVVGVALDSVIRSRTRLGTAIAIVVPLALAGDSIRQFLRENGGAPNRALVLGVEGFNASGLRPREFGSGNREGIEFYKAAGPVALINHIVLASDPPARVLLVGDATPLYFADAGDRVVYTAPWDTNPILSALDAHPDNPDAAMESLRTKGGFTHILFNLSELDRLRSSGYTDPRLTSYLAREWTRRMRVVMTWPERGQILVAFPSAPVDSAAQ